MRGWIAERDAFERESPYYRDDVMKVLASQNSRKCTAGPDM